MSTVTKKALPYTLVANEDGERTLTVYSGKAEPVMANSSNPQFDTILSLVQAGNEKGVEMMSIALFANSKFERLTERISVKGGFMYFDNDLVNDALAQQVVRFVEEGVEDWKPLVLFFENLMQNPNEHSRNSLYPWIEAQNVSITPDGLMIGYKGLHRDNKVKGENTYRAGHDGKAIVDGVGVNGKVVQKIGSTVEMPRTEVMHLPAAECDAGLHVGSYDYAKGFAEVVVEVHVNPRDVVSVPNAGWKLRTCRYKVIKEIEAPYSTAVVSTPKAPKKETKSAAKTSKNTGQVEEVRVGDVYADTDKRRDGRTVKVTSFDQGQATVLDNNGKESKVKLERLQSRAFQRTTRGRKPKAVATN